MAKCPKCEQHELVKVAGKKSYVLKCAGGKDNGGCGFWSPTYERVTSGEPKPQPAQKPPAKAPEGKPAPKPAEPPAPAPARGNNKSWLSRTLDGIL